MMFINKSVFRESSNLYQGLFTSLAAGLGGLFGWLIDPAFLVPIICTVIMGIFGLIGIILKHYLEKKKS